MEKVQFITGDYVSIAGLDHETRMALKERFDEAATSKELWVSFTPNDNFLGIDRRDGRVYSNASFISDAFTGRDLTVSQVLGEEEKEEDMEIDCSRPQDYEYEGREILHIWDTRESIGGDFFSPLIVCRDGPGLYSTHWADAEGIKKRSKFEPIPGKWYQVSEKEDFSGRLYIKVFDRFGPDGEFVPDVGAPWSYCRPIPKEKRSQFVFEGDEQ